MINSKLKKMNYTKILFCVFVLFATNIQAQHSHPSAALEVNSTTQGFLPPVMTSDQMNAINNPAAGLMVFNQTDQHIYYYNPSANNWIAIDANTNSNPYANAIIGLNGAFDTQNEAGAVVVTIYNNSLNEQNYSFNNADLSLNGTGAANISVASTSPATLNIATGQSGTVTYDLTGTPSSSGNLNLSWTFSSLSASKDTTIQ